MDSNRMCCILFAFTATFLVTYMSGSFAGSLLRVVHQAPVVANLPLTTFQRHALQPFSKATHEADHSIAVKHKAIDPLAGSSSLPEVKAASGWGLVGMEIAGLAALCAAVVSRVGAPMIKPEPIRSEHTSEKAYNWATGLTAFLLALPTDAAFVAEQASTGYSQASYYTALGTYLIALPGLVSLVTRSVKPKIVRKTYVLPGPNAGGLPQKEIAGKLLFYLTKTRNFELKEAGKTVTFKGKLGLRKGQAGFLTACVFLSLLSLGLVIQTIETATYGEGQGLGNWWYALSLLSPLAGKYYMDNAGGEMELQLKIVSDDDEKETEITIQGDDAELEGIRLQFDWQEKGMVRVKGLFEDQIKPQ